MPHASANCPGSPPPNLPGCLAGATRTDPGARGPGRGPQSSLPAGGYLASEHSELGWLTSAGGEYSLVLRADGDLGLFWMGGYGTQLWSAGTAQTDWKSKGPFRLVLLRTGVCCRT